MTTHSQRVLACSLWCVPWRLVWGPWESVEVLCPIRTHHTAWTGLQMGNKPPASLQKSAMSSDALRFHLLGHRKALRLEEWAQDLNPSLAGLRTMTRPP